MKLMGHLLCRGYLKSGVGWEEKLLDKNDVAKVGIAKVGPHPGSFKMDLGYLEMDRMEIPISSSHCRPGAGVGLMSAELPSFLLIFWGRVWSSQAHSSPTPLPSGDLPAAFKRPAATPRLE